MRCLNGLKGGGEESIAQIGVILRTEGILLHFSTPVSPFTPHTFIPSHDFTFPLYSLYFKPHYRSTFPLHSLKSRPYLWVFPLYSLLFKVDFLNEHLALREAQLVQGADQIQNSHVLAAANQNKWGKLDTCVCFGVCLCGCVCVCLCVCLCRFVR